MNKIVNLEKKRKAMKLSIFILQFQVKKQKQTNKQPTKQINLLTLTVSCEKRSCLIRSKKKKQNKTKQN